MAMRHILIDHARTRGRLKRGGGLTPETLDDRALAVSADADRLLLIEDALEKLGAVDPRLVRVVECRFFAGLSEEETAQALGISLRTAQRDWLKARAWLRQALA
jgi:RNA polymerase sigma factor (TIGR02999 family)